MSAHLGFAVRVRYLSFNAFYVGMALRRGVMPSELSLNKDQGDLASAIGASCLIAF
jgi:hypothetical protein